MWKGLVGNKKTKPLSQWLDLTTIDEVAKFEDLNKEAKEVAEIVDGMKILLKRKRKGL